MKRAAIALLVCLSMVFISGWNLKNQKFPRGQRCGKTFVYGAVAPADTTALVNTELRNISFTEASQHESQDRSEEWFHSTTGGGAKIERCFRPPDGLDGVFVLDLGISVNYSVNSDLQLFWGINAGEGVANGDEVDPAFWASAKASNWTIHRVRTLQTLSNNDCIAPLIYPVSDGTLSLQYWWLSATEVSGCRDQED